MQNIGENRIALSSDFELKPKPSAPPMTNKRVNITPINGATNYNPQDQIIFDCPTGKANQFLDCTSTVLKLSIKNTEASAPWAVDHSAASFIRKIEILANGSTQIEVIDFYNDLYCKLMDTNYSSLDRQSYQSVYMGTDMPLGDSAGLTVNFSRGGQVVTAGATRNWYIPLISGIVGPGAGGKLLPIQHINELRVVVTLAPNTEPIISGTSTATSTNVWQVTSSELIMNIVQLDEQVNKMLHESNGGDVIRISSETWRGFQTVLQASQTSDTVLMPQRLSSVKTLLLSYRSTGNFGVYTTGTISSRLNPFASGTPSFQSLIGNTYTPLKPIVNSQELFIELQKSFHSIGNTNNKTVINSTTWNIASEPTAAATSGTAINDGSTGQTAYNTYCRGAGSFVLGLNYDIIPGQTNRSMCGTSFIQGNSFIQQTYSSGLPSGGVTMTGHLHCDLILEIDPQLRTLTTKI